ncbi:MAG: hypothetical protein EHM93_04510 [Bacteroidales bacterium]|nr:MAG: hypothetical protein EHM93_04510 [Bacteroidales bacterium]
MNRKIFNFFVLAITILLVNLLTTFIADYLMKYRGQTDFLKFTAIGMGVIVLVFYPAFEYMNGIVEKFTTKFLKKGNNLFGRTIGIYITFLVMLFILYCVYAHIWFNVNVIKVIFIRIFS